MKECRQHLILYKNTIRKKFTITATKLLLRKISSIAERE